MEILTINQETTAAYYIAKSLEHLKQMPEAAVAKQLNIGNPVSAENSDSNRHFVNTSA